jgi:hypothetical protein
MVTFKLADEAYAVKFQQVFIESLIRVIKRFSEENVLVKGVLIATYQEVKDLNNWLDQY